MKSLWVIGTLALCLTQSPLFAGGTVTNCNEVDLRFALLAGGTVNFDCDGTIVLTNTVVITNNVLLNAAGRSVTISGGNAVRLFHILPGVTLTLQNLSLADGAAIGTNGDLGVAGGLGAGGAIYNEGGTLKAIACQFLRNRALGGTGGNSSGGPFPTLGAGGLGQGGAVYNANGQVSATNCIFMENRALGGVAGVGTSGAFAAVGGNAAGGVIYNTAGGTIHIVDSVTVGNSVVSGQGRRFGIPSLSGVAYGGVMHSGSGTVIINGGVIASNSCSAELGSSAANGGAIYQDGGVMTLLNTTLRANRVSGGRGITGGTPSQKGGDASGGAVCSVAGILGVTNCALVGNIADGGPNGAGMPSGSGSGGGIFNTASLSLHNTTLAKNSALGGQSALTPGSGYGGGLYNDGEMSLTYVTIADNIAKRSIGSDPYFIGVSEGGGIWNTNSSAIMRGTILSGNSPGSNCFGTIIDGGHNLSSDPSCNFTNSGSLNSTDPKLGPLDSYGGLTLTMPLLSGSPAIDGGDQASFPPIDQRGRVRPYGAAPDIGAFESSEPFVIRGELSSSTFAEETSVHDGVLDIATTNHGSYSFEGLAAGTYTVTPSTATYLAVPANRVVTVGPDQVNVDFKAYRWNALSLEGASNGVLRLVFAGTNGQQYRVLASSNLVEWVTLSTNTTGTSNLFDIFDLGIRSNYVRFYRTIMP